MGVPGPGGPCSEIYIDRGPEFGPDGGPEADEDRFLEIWNLTTLRGVTGLHLTTYFTHHPGHATELCRLPPAADHGVQRQVRALGAPPGSSLGCAA